MLYTIGYENSSFEDLVTKLNNLDVKKLIDVREIPLSRKKGFSKSYLCKNLPNFGISYVHLKELGSPAHLRQKLHKDKNYKYFFREYYNYLNTQREILKELHTLIINETSCLMCYEKSAEHCHRLIIGQEIKKINGNGLFVGHI